MNRTKVMRGFHLVIALALTLGAGLPHVRADDTDVFFPADPDTPGQRNLLIVLDNNSNWSENSQGFDGQTTGEAEINAIKTAIATLDANTNVGLMQFVTTEGGGAVGGFVRYHMRPMNDTNKAALTAILTAIHGNINDPAEKINASSAEYGSLMQDAYEYLKGGSSVAPTKVEAALADEDGYTTAYTAFNSPLDDDPDNCGPTSIVFVSNPSPSTPRDDTAANTTALAAAGGITTQITVPRTITYTDVPGTGTASIGYTSSCLASLAACTSAVRLADYPSQCGDAADCSCRENFVTTTTTVTDTAPDPDSSTATITVVNNSTAAVNTSSTVGTVTTSTTHVATTTTTTDLPACGAGTQRYTIKGVTNNTAAVSDNTVVSTNITTDPVVSVCLKTSVAGQSLPYTLASPYSCPTQTQTSTPNTPASGQTTTVTTTWSNCTVPSGTSAGSGCTNLISGSSGSKTYIAKGDKSVRTVVTNDAAPQTFTTLGNTFACCATSGTCSATDYSTAKTGSANDCTDFNGGCIVTSPTSPDLTPSHGSCPSGSRYDVVSNAGTVTVSPMLVDGAYVPAGTTTGAPADASNFDEWARMLKTVGVNGKKVTTYTIDVFKNQPGDDYTKLMLSGAKVGGGEYFSATSQTEISNALNEILDVVLDIDTTFAAPAVTVNTFNRLTNRDELYFALFKPIAEVKWEGNLKKYTLKQFSGVTKIADANNLEAVDIATGFFKSTAKSVWSDTVDGAEVSFGGAVNRYTNPVTRKTFTYTGADKPPASTVSPVDVSATAHGLLSSNTTSPGDSGNITKAMVGLPATAPYSDLTNILDWAHGIDVDDIDLDNDITDARQSFGDPLHSQPVVITYKQTGTAPSIVADTTVYFGDNEGALHAVDTATGDEIFAFTPKELLKNLSSYRNNVGDYKRRPYGLDGPITRRHKDLNSDLLVLNSDGTVQTTSSVEEFIHLYVGMRRGGRNYYSLDVTRRATPQLRWAIYGGSGSYTELGQTWSDAVVRKIKYKGAVKDVLIFTGGYDPDADSFIKLKDSADQGRAVFIADADTGERLWWASLSGADLNLSNMKFSIPASPKVVDLDADGLADRIYVADSGGQIFRIILNASHAAADTAANLATGTRIAMLSDADTAEASRTEANARRFFAAPDVALNEVSGERFLTIAIGSGYRENPNNTTIQDRFYVLQDPDFQKGTVTSLALTESSLFDTTLNLIAQGTDAEKAAAQTSLDAASGFYIKLNTAAGVFVGEKVFTESLTIAGNAVFASFTPNITSSACSVVPGQSRLYLLSVINGAPFVDYSDTTDPAKCSTTSCDRADRSVILAQQGLPSDPALIFPSFGGGLVCIGSECNPAQFSNTVNKVHWLKRSD